MRRNRILTDAHDALVEMETRRDPFRVRRWRGDRVGVRSRLPVRIVSYDRQFILLAAVLGFLAGIFFKAIGVAW